MQWHIVVAASKNYEPGLRAFLNSLYHYHGHDKFAVHVLRLAMPEFTESFGLNIRFHDLDWVEHGGQRNTAWSTKIPRFKYAANLNGIVMLCDADMFFCANTEWMFILAEMGYIIAGSNGSNVSYNQQWRDKYKLPIPDFYNYKTVCSVPTVMNPELHGVVWKDIYTHKMAGGEGADFDLQNIFFTIHRKQNRIIALPSQQTTGIHHYMLKPDSRVINVNGKLVTRDGLEVYLVHGKWWQKGWRDNLITKMEHYCKGNHACVTGAVQSRNILYEEFKRWSDA